MKNNKEGNTGVEMKTELQNLRKKNHQLENDLRVKNADLENERQEK